MPIENIIAGQKVDRSKVQRSKELRCQMTDEEATLWQHLRKNRLNGLHFRRQQVIDGFIVDFYCHAAGLVIELDGGVHRQRGEYDLERDRSLSARGLHVLRIRNEDLRKDLSGVLARIGALVNRSIKT